MKETYAIDEHGLFKGALLQSLRPCMEYTSPSGDFFIKMSILESVQSWATKAVQTYITFKARISKYATSQVHHSSTVVNVSGLPSLKTPLNMQ